jgi:DNA-binding NarL/FixJ family response regulator
MELRFDGCGYSITGTPAEMWEFLTLDDSEKTSAPAPDPVEQEPEQAPAPTPKKPRKAPTPDWDKARALRNAGWTLKEIGRELHVSPQTVANHLAGGNDDE